MAALTGPLGDVLDLLAPPRCLACRRRAPLPWCPRCASRVVVLHGGCPRCAAPRGRGHPCWPAGVPVAGTIAVYDYRGPVARAIVTAKVRGAWAGWAPLADALGEAVAAADPQVDAVTWITTPTRRARRRDGDHARRLAAVSATALGVPLVCLLAADEQPGGGDLYRARSSLPGSRLLLVDDVITTGATALRAATALRQAGADAVHLAVVARAGSHPLAGDATAATSSRSVPDDSTPTARS